MMNIEMKESSGQLTVKELREFLLKHEEQWNKTDEQYLGEFEDQMIISLPPNKGYTSSKIVEAFGCGGFFIIPTNKDGSILND